MEAWPKPSRVIPGLKPRITSGNCSGPPPICPKPSPALRSKAISSISKAFGMPRSRQILGLPAKRSPDTRRTPSISRLKSRQNPASVGVSPNDHLMVIDPIPPGPIAFGEVKLVVLALVPQRPAAGVVGTFPGINDVAQIVDRAGVGVRLTRHIDPLIALPVVQRRFRLRTRIQPYLGHQAGIVDASAERALRPGHVLRGVFAAL